MPSGERTAKVIIRLKKVCKERGLSPSDVYDLVTAEYGCQQVSLSSIHRIFDVGSEDAGFRYSTIKPIVKVLLGVVEDSEINGDNDEFDPDRAREYYTERNALQEVVRLKAAEEERLRTRLAELEQSSKEEISRLSLLHDKNIDRLLTQHQKQDECQDRTIETLEKNNAFLQQTVETLRVSLAEERESKKRMYADIKRYMEELQALSRELAELRKHHNE